MPVSTYLCSAQPHRHESAFGTAGTARIPNAPMAASADKAVICSLLPDQERAEAVWRKNDYVRLNGN